MVGLGGLKQLVAALGPAMAPLLASLLQAAATGTGTGKAGSGKTGTGGGCSLWARLGQPMGSTDGPRLVEVANELTALYRRHPDPAGVVGCAAQTAAAAISSVLTSSPAPDKAGLEQATSAARILADAAAAAPRLAGEAVARAFLVSGAPRRLFSVAFPPPAAAAAATFLSDGGGGGSGDVVIRSHFASEEAILALYSIAALVPDRVGGVIQVFSSFDPWLERRLVSTCHKVTMYN